MRQALAFPPVRLVIIVAGFAVIIATALAAQGGRYSVWTSVVVTKVVL
jgi:uncharacterized protein (DUF983 family)